MARKDRNVTDYELAVLNVLWQQQPATIGEITEAIYGERTTASYATVQKLLERLESKGCVRRDRSTFAHRFSATVERSELIGQGLESLAEKLCEGSLTPLLLHLAGRTKLTEQERRTLRELMERSR